LKVRLGDREFEISPLTLGDWKKIEKRFGGNMQQLSTNPTFDQISYIIWYAIHKHDNSVRQEEIDELIVPGSKEYKEIMELLTPGSAKAKN